VRRDGLASPSTHTHMRLALVPKTWCGAAGIAGTDDDGDGFGGGSASKVKAGYH
jgi:hypothetical protein